VLADDVSFFFCDTLWGHDRVHIFNQPIGRQPA